MDNTYDFVKWPGSRWHIATGETTLCEQRKLIDVLSAREMPIVRNEDTENLCVTCKARAIQKGIKIYLQPEVNEKGIQECARCGKPLADNEVFYFGAHTKVCLELRGCFARQKYIHIQTGGKW